MGLWTLVDAGIGGGGAGLTNPLADDESLVFGTTTPSSLTAITTTSNDEFRLAVGTTSPILVITTEANKTYDFLNIVGPGITDPFIFVSSGNAVNNEFYYLRMDSASRRVSIECSSGDDVDGTPRTATGFDLILRTGSGGSLGAGGRGGNLIYEVSNADGAGNNDAGHHIFSLKSATGTGTNTEFRTTGNNADVQWSVSVGNYFAVKRDGITGAVKFAHDGTNSLYETSTGLHNFNQSVSVTGNIRATAKGAFGTTVGTNTDFRVGNNTQDAAGVLASIGKDFTDTAGTRIGLDARARAAITGASTATYIGFNATANTTSLLGQALTSLIGTQSFAIADMSGVAPVGSIIGASFGASATGGGVITSMIGSQSQVLINSGGVTEAIVHWVKDITNLGSAGVTNAYGLKVDAPGLGTNQFTAAFGTGNSYFSGNLTIGATTPGATASDVLCLSNSATDPTTSVDRTHLYSKDVSGGNATLAIYTETAVAADVGLASTDSLTVFINGSKYKIPLVLVP